MTSLAVQATVSAIQRKKQIVVQVHHGARSVVASQAISTILSAVAIKKPGIQVGVAGFAEVPVKARVRVQVAVGTEKDAAVGGPAVACQREPKLVMGIVRPRRNADIGISSQMLAVTLYTLFRVVQMAVEPILSSGLVLHDQVAGQTALRFGALPWTVTAGALVFKLGVGAKSTPGTIKAVSGRDWSGAKERVTLKPRVAAKEDHDPKSHDYSQRGQTAKLLPHIFLDDR